VQADADQDWLVRRTGRTLTGLAAMGSDDCPLLLGFPYLKLYRKQVVRQADLVLAMHRTSRTTCSPRSPCTTWRISAIGPSTGCTWPR